MSFTGSTQNWKEYWDTLGLTEGTLRHIKESNNTSFCGTPDLNQLSAKHYALPRCKPCLTKCLYITEGVNNE